MSLHTLTKVAASEDAVPSHIVLRRRPGQWAAVAVQVLLGLAVNSVVRKETFQRDVVGDHFTSASVLRGLRPTALVMALGFALGALLAVQDLLHSVRLAHHRAYQVTPLLMVAALWYVTVTSVLSVGRHYARGSERTR